MSTKIDEVVAIDAHGMRPCAPATSLGQDEEVRETAMQPEQRRASQRSWKQEDFAREQLRGLILRLFFPGWPKPLRQVVISSADTESDVARVCIRIVREMAASLPGRVCALEANLYHPEMARLLTAPMAESTPIQANGSRAITRNLWLLNPRITQDEPLTAAWVRTTMGELRQTFDFTLIHAPAALTPESVVLGQLADGMILVIHARSTHRAVARKTLEILKAAKVPVLGTVLADRTFPIPEVLYRKL